MPSLIMLLMLFYFDMVARRLPSSLMPSRLPLPAYAIQPLMPPSF